MNNATSFGRQAKTYAKGRPGYPPALYAWIVENCARHDLVWDVGTGSGQAARSLADHFSAVHATDVSIDQIAAAKPHPHVKYYVGPAHKSGLSNRSVDCITVATALHWFATAEFWTEVKRVAAKDAVFCAWTYQLPQSHPAVHAAFLDPIYKLIDPYWAEGNRICMAGYTSDALNCPFPTLDTPTFDAGGVWSARQLVDFATSWSAHFRAREDGHSENLTALSSQFLADFRDREIHFDMPISILAARIS